MRRLRKRERQHVGHHAHFAGELERVFAAAVVNQLNKESREPARRLVHSSHIDARFVFFQRRAGVSVSDRVHSKIASLRIGRLPDIHLTRFVFYRHNQCAVLLFFPGESRAGSVVDHRLIERQQAFACIGAGEVVLGVGNVAKILLALKLAEIELRVVRQEELIARRVDQILWNLEPVAIAIVVGVFDCQDVLILRGPDLVGEQLVIDVIVQGRRKEAVSLDSDAG